MAYDPRFLEGIRLFNDLDFHAAHDEWESLWLETEGEEKDFLQGLILCAVSLHHYGNRNHNGGRSRFRRALEYLDPYPDRFWGINLKKFLRRMNGSLHRLLTSESPPELDRKTVPKLQVDSRS